METRLPRMLVIGCLIAAVILGLYGTGIAQGLQTVAESAILVEEESGQILYSKNPDEKLPPASITKIMTLLLAMEDIESGKVKLTDKVTASALAASMGGSQIYLKEHEEMTLDELLEAIAVVSANDACVAVAEYLSGSEDEFVNRMNQRAKELGMVNSNFVNTNGLPAKEHHSSARDIALMSRELLKYPQILKYTKVWTSALRGGKFHLKNTNELIAKYPGADGLKTGWTDEAGFCLSGTAIKNGLRLIAVVMRTPSGNARVQETAKLLDYGFRNFEKVQIVKKGQVKAKVRVKDGAKEDLRLITSKKWMALVPKGGTAKVVVKSEINEKIQAPIKKGQVLGRLVATRGDQKLGSIPLIAEEPVKRANILVLFFRSIRDLLASILTFGRK